MMISYECPQKNLYKKYIWLIYFWISIISNISKLFIDSRYSEINNKINQINQLARESFEEIGLELKQRLKCDIESMFDMLMQCEEDPSVYTDKDLKLNDNKKIANEKREKIFFIIVSMLFAK